MLFYLIFYLFNIIFIKCVPLLKLALCPFNLFGKWVGILVISARYIFYVKKAKEKYFFGQSDMQGSTKKF